MSPVHSIAAPDLSIRHHHVSPTPETLFPECPDDLSPQQVAGSLVPLAGQHGSNADRATPDCPPATVATDRPPNHSSSPVRNSAADPSNRAHARLVGIARLAAASPPAETTRRSAERPEYFVLPVKSILTGVIPSAYRLNGPSIPSAGASLPASIATRGTRTNTWSLTEASSRKRFT